MTFESAYLENPTPNPTSKSRHESIAKLLPSDYSAHTAMKKLLRAIVIAKNVNTLLTKECHKVDYLAGNKTIRGQSFHTGLRVLVTENDVTGVLIGCSHQTSTTILPQVL